MRCCCWDHHRHSYHLLVRFVHAGYDRLFQDVLVTLRFRQVRKGSGRVQDARVLLAGLQGHRHALTRQRQQEMQIAFPERREIVVVVAAAAVVVLAVTAVGSSRSRIVARQSRRRTRGRRFVIARRA